MYKEVKIWLIGYAKELLIISFVYAPENADEKKRLGRPKLIHVAPVMMS